MAKFSIDGQALKALFSAGLERLSNNVALINQLNVFPVPDGDTGVNMYHTLKRAYEEITPIESENVSVIADRFASGALMGARGNSGTILSQLLKGFAEGLDRAQSLTPPLLLQACQSAVTCAYLSVSDPAEGTILTVAREATEHLQNSSKEGAMLEDMLDTLIVAARASLKNTPNLLPILKEAGVVDAGGMGLLCFLQGMQDGEGEIADEAETVISTEIHDMPATSAVSGSYGYDVQFLMIGEGMDIAQVRRVLESLGWSVIVVGDEGTIKVHIHVDNPAIPLDYAIKSGAQLDDIVVENMQLQYESYVMNQPKTEPATAHLSSVVSVIAVAEGDGMHAVFRDLNCACVISGGAGQNPATEDFISAISRLQSNQVVILPNDRNIIMAAEQAARFVTGKQVRIVPTRTVLQGISAMVAFGDSIDSNADLETMVAHMNAAGADVSSIKITRATRSTQLRGLDIEQNDYIAIVDGMIIASADDIKTVMLEAFSELKMETKELATLYYGAGISESESIQLIEHLRNTINGLEFDVVYGGQALYPFLISVE